MEVYPERQKKNKKTRFVCNFNGKSVFRCTQRAITQRRVITLGPIFIKMVLNQVQDLKKKSQEVSARKNNNRQRYNKKCRRGRIPPPALLRLTLWSTEKKYNKRLLQNKTSQINVEYRRIYTLASYSVYDFEHDSYESAILQSLCMWWAYLFKRFIYVIRD